MRIITFYLPQFHEVEENSKWWGMGFTDWQPTMNAVPQYEGHYQPHTPLNKNYYNLLDSNVLRWQSSLMKKYGIEGQAIYHYWFKDGKKILEKPAELLLEEKDIDMPFCFYWANESWVRSWSKLKQEANPWMNDVKESDDNDDGILMVQEYGEESEWRNHFEYLLPFFKDPRYIKVDNKPLFIIYKSTIIPKLEEMLTHWRNWAKENGLEGIYVIGAYRNGRLDSTGLDAQLLHEPPRANLIFYEKNRGEGVTKLNYDEVWQYVLNEFKYDCKTYYSAFVGYDDSPRRGKRGIVLEGQNPEKYKNYLSRLIAKNKASGNDITFINAWNEWGEGMHLEPDEKNRYAFLDATKTALEEYGKFVNEYVEKMNSTSKNFAILQSRCEKFEMYMNYFDTWMSLHEKNISLALWFKKRNIKRIIVYGYGNMGRHLVSDLRDSNVEVVGLIDRQKDKLSSDIKFYSLDDELPICDAVVVSAFYFYDEIHLNLSKNLNVLSLKNIINDLSSEGLG